jgi:type I restriction enzyme, S subunit
MNPNLGFYETIKELLPKDWDYQNLSKNIVNILPGFAFKSSYFTNTQGISLIRVRDVDKISTVIRYDGPYSDKYIVSKNDLIIGMDGNFTISKWKGNNALLNQRVCKIDSSNKNILQDEYLNYVIRNPIKKIECLTPHTTVKHLSTKDIRKIKIPVPPLGEQRGIAEVLGTIDDSIRVQEQIIAKTELLKTGLMERLITEGIGHKEYKETRIGRLPDTWNIITLSDLVEYKNGIYKPAEYYGKGPPSIRMNHITDGEITKKGAPLLDVTEEELLDYGLVAGDLIINRVNSRYLVGKLGIVPPNFGPATFESKNIRMRSKTSTVDSQFLNYVLNSARKQYTIRSYAKSAVGQATITQSDLNRIQIQIPPFREQQIIVKIINKMKKQIKTLVKEKESQVELKHGLMQVLLIGERRVELRADGLHRV